MKKIMIVISALMCFVLFASMTFAGDKAVDNPVTKDREPWFKPSLSVGYAFSSDTHIKLGRESIGIVGLRDTDLKIPGFSGVYLAGELPFALTDRFKVTLGGRLAFPGSDKEMDQSYNDNSLLRFWDSNDRYWVTADLLLSYAFVKNLSFLKDLSGVLGFRWDYHTMSFDNPHNTFAIVTSPLDTVSFRMYTYTPVLGLTSTFKGFKYGIFGGDVKLGLFGSPIGWGNAKYREEYGQFFVIRFDGDIDRVSFFNILGDFTLLSGKITPGMEASLSFFAQYTKFFTRERLSGVGYAGGALGGQGDFNFKMRPDLTAVGVKASLAF
jgi:hypothetical protein